MELKVNNNPNYLAAADGHLIIIQVRVEDVANYSCVAENIVNRRISSPARLEILGKLCIVSNLASNLVHFKKLQTVFLDKVVWLWF